MRKPLILYEDCGRPFVPNGADQRHCARACRAKAYRNRPKTRALSAAIHCPIENVREPSRPPPTAAPRRERADRSPSRLKLCGQSDYPRGLFECRNADGLPTFFDGRGDRLMRSWAGGPLPAIELRVMKVATTGLASPAGCLYRAVKVRIP